MTSPNHVKSTCYKSIVKAYRENKWDEVADKEVKRKIVSKLKEIKEDTNFWTYSKEQQIAAWSKAVDTGYESRIQ